MHENESSTVGSLIFDALSNDVICTRAQKHDDIQPMGPEEFKEVTMVMGKDARKLHRMGILTGKRRKEGGGREGERERERERGRWFRCSWYTIVCVSYDV